MSYYILSIVQSEPLAVLCRVRTSSQWLFSRLPAVSFSYLSSKFSILQYATDFYQAITNITSGLMLPLTTANLLSHAIIGSVLENLDMERLIREVGQAVAQRILGNQESVDDVARELHEKLLLRNESTKKIVFENIYRESPEAKHNVQVFSEAPNLSAARPLLKKVSVVFLCAFYRTPVIDQSWDPRFKVVASQKSIYRFDNMVVPRTRHIRVTALYHIGLQHLHCPQHQFRPLPRHLPVRCCQTSLPLGHPLQVSLGRRLPLLHFRLQGEKQRLERSGTDQTREYMGGMKTKTMTRRFLSEKERLHLIK